MIAGRGSTGLFGAFSACFGSVSASDADERSRRRCGAAEAHPGCRVALTPLVTAGYNAAGDGLRRAVPGSVAMRLGKVVGTVVATQKSESLVGGKLLVVQDLDPVSMKPKDSYTVAYDTVGVGAQSGEVVLTVAGSSARLTDATKDKPVDTAIIAIVDCVEVHGKTVYNESC